MLANYLKIALRFLLKNKIYAAINIIGLSVGIAACFLILIYVEDEYSFDNFHEKGNQIYRVALERIYPERRIHYAVIPAGYSRAFKNDFAEVKESVRLLNVDGDITFEYKEIPFKERRVIFADSNFFKVFTFPLLKGNPEEALLKPRSVIMSESTAKKYFGDEEAIGKIITVQDSVSFQVTGVCKDVPKNSHFEFDLLISIKSPPFLDFQQPDFISFSVHNYLLLNKNTDAKKLEAKFLKLVEKYAAGQIKSRLGISFKEYQKAGNGYRYFLQPLRDIHLKSHLEAEIKPNGNIIYVNIFIIIALFIMILACINFTNMATAQSMERAKEVGMRKVLGSERKQLIQQFLVESLLFSFVSLILAFLWIELLLPAFNNLANKELEINLMNIPLILKLVGLTLLVGLLSGFYPAFVLSSFNPVVVLKGKFKSSKKGTLLRNTLVVFQFATSIVLISCTLIVYQQLNYIQSKNLGFDREHLLVIENVGLLNQRGETFKKEILKNPQITRASGSNTSLSDGFYFGIMFQPGGANSEVITSRGMVIDEHYFQTMGLQLKEGRAFSKQFNDSLSVIFNETAAKDFGLKEPIGKQILQPGDTPEQSRYLKVIGIVKDFHYQSLHQPIGSLVLLSNRQFGGGYGFITIKVRSENMQQTITQLEKKWKEFESKESFSYHFFDKKMGELYQAETSTGKIFTAFAGLAILIACIGLLGLIAYIAQNRQKEIGIRKVLGASLTNILTLLSRDFILLVLLANVIAVPLAFYFMQSWLSNFAYRTSLNPLPFLAAGLIALLIALLTVSFLTFKAASVNPVVVLKNE